MCDIPGDLSFQSFFEKSILDPICRTIKTYVTSVLVEYLFVHDYEGVCLRVSEAHIGGHAPTHCVLSLFWLKEQSIHYK